MASHRVPPRPVAGACCSADLPPFAEELGNYKISWKSHQRREEVSVIKDVCTAKFKGCSSGVPAYRIVCLGRARESNANSDQSGFFVH